MLSILFAILALSALTYGHIQPGGSYMHEAMLTSESSSYTVKLFWNFSDTHIIFEVHGNTTGWIGIGLSPNGGMIGADIYVGWVKNGTVKVTDRHGIVEKNFYPPLDAQQDIDVLEGSECDGWTMFKFSRQLAACEDNDTEIPRGTQRVIWALGETDPLGDDIQPSDYHKTARGVKSLHLLSPNQLRGKDFVGPEFKTFDITPKNFRMPARKTHYNCRIVELPALEKKHHIVKFEPVIQKGNEAFIHHILVMSCRGPLQMGDYVTWPTPAKDSSLLCARMGKSIKFKKKINPKNIPAKGTWKVGEDRPCASTDPTIFCLEVLVGWGVGGTSATQPDVSGISIGTENDPRFVMIQTHYDNPKKFSGIIDSSGIRITYTPRLRQYDSGVIVVGQTVAGNMHYIPPGAESFRTITSCRPECLGKKMKEAGVENITVHQVLLHSHLAGRSMRLRHFRDGIELPYISNDETYNFNYQEYLPLDPFVTILPGDELQMECVYSTLGRDYVTEGGDATSQEMCFGFFGYFPKLEFSNCQSNIPPELSLKYFGIESFEIKPNRNPLTLDACNITAPAEFAGETALEVVSQYNWTKKKIENFNSFLHGLEHWQFCVGDDTTDFTLHSFNFSKIETPYVAPQRNCNEPSSPLNRNVHSKDCPGGRGSSLKASVYLCAILVILTSNTLGSIWPRI